MVGCQSHEIGTKTTKKHIKMMGRLYLPDGIYTIPACVDQDPDITWGWDHFLPDKTGNYQEKPLNC